MLVRVINPDSAFHDCVGHVTDLSSGYRTTVDFCTTFVQFDNPAWSNGGRAVGFNPNELEPVLN